MHCRIRIILFVENPIIHSSIWSRSLAEAIGQKAYNRSDLSYLFTRPPHLNPLSRYYRDSCPHPLAMLFHSRHSTQVLTVQRAVAKSASIHLMARQQTTPATCRKWQHPCRLLSWLIKMICGFVPIVVTHSLTARCYRPTSVKQQLLRFRQSFSRWLSDYFRG